MNPCRGKVRQYHMKSNKVALCAAHCINKSIVPYFKATSFWADPLTKTDILFLIYILFLRFMKLKT